MGNLALATTWQPPCALACDVNYNEVVNVHLEATGQYELD